MPAIKNRLSRVFGTALLFFIASPQARAQEFRQVMITADHADLRDGPSPTWPILRQLPRGQVLTVDDDSGWWKTTAGWLKKADTSPAYALSRNFGSDDLARYLEQNIAAAQSNSLVWSWLSFYQGHLLWAREQHDKAVAVFEAIGQREPPSQFSPFGFVAAAKVRLSQRKVGDALTVYQTLRRKFPRFELPPYGECLDLPILIEPEIRTGASICWGDASISKRIAALSAMERIAAETQRALHDRKATGAQRATLLYQLGRRWSETDSVDPAIAIRETETIIHANSEEAYKAAVAAAPGSRGAGYAAWELISFERPYELEGNYEPEADRWLEQYGGFLRQYPNHPLSGEAMFMIARAKWTKAGYPELFGYLQEGQNQREVSQFLDTWGFGGPVPRVDRRPQDTREPLRLFREIVRRYPRTRSAAAAQYYVAVILDWCLNDAAHALPEYEKFVAVYPASENVAIAQRRIESLRKK